jgi:hypothetical protein
MASSTFWRALGARFTALKTAMQADSWLTLKAVWISDHSVTPPIDHWELQANDTGFRLRFEAIAVTGGDALSPKDLIEPLYAWIVALVRDSRITGISRTPIADGFELDNLIEASINLCASMEADMFKAERHRRYLDSKPAPPAVAAPSPPPIQPEPPQSAPVQLPSPAIAVSARSTRQSGAIENFHAARRTVKYLDDRGIRQVDFARRAKISVRTLRSFLKTGKLRKNSLPDLCKAMKIDQETLLSDFSLTGN